MKSICLLIDMQYFNTVKRENRKQYTDFKRSLLEYLRQNKRLNKTFLPNI
jgi:hypothetical protein